MKTFVALAACLAAFLQAASAADAPGDAVIITHQVTSPEGPIFVDGALYVVDYAAHDVVRVRFIEEMIATNPVWHRDGCGPTGLARVPEGLLVACFDGRYVATISLDGRTLSIAENDDKGERLREPNDFALDASGGAYFSGTGPWEPDPVVGRIYHRDAKGAIRTLARDLHSPNGVALSPDGKLLYVAESFASRLLAFDVQPDGTLAGQRVFADFRELIPEAAKTLFTPDGVRADRNGNLFVGFWDGSCFVVLSPQGKLLKRVDLPAMHTPNLAISPDGRYVYSTGVFDLPDKSSRGELYRVPNPMAAP